MDFELVEREAFGVVGVRRVTPFGGGTWAAVRDEGLNEAVKAACGRAFDLGLCFGFKEDGSNDYMCAIQWSGEKPDGFDSYSYPACSSLRFRVGGKISDAALDAAWRGINEFLPRSQYKKSNFPSIERYILWDEALDICEVEILIPVERK